jgi:SPOR domain
LNFDVHSDRAHAGEDSDASWAAAHAQRDGGDDGVYEHDAFAMKRLGLHYDRTHAPRRGLLVTVMAVVALAVIGAAGAFGYLAISGGSRPATQPAAVKADREPGKAGPRMEEPRIAFPPSNPPDAPQSTASVADTPSPAAAPPPEPAAASVNEPKKSAAQRPTRIAAAPNPPAQASSASARASYVQVSSLRSETDAQASFKALQGKYPNVLGDKQAVIRRAELGGKGVYYRAMVGPFASVEQAAELCGNLKAAGGQCVVQRN